MNIIQELRNFVKRFFWFGIRNLMWRKWGNKKPLEPCCMYISKARGGKC